MKTAGEKLDQGLLRKQNPLYHGSIGIATMGHSQVPDILRMDDQVRCRSRLSSAAWRSGSERRYYDDHDREVDGSIPTQV